MPDQINITVNGVKKAIFIDEKETLLEILRDKLELTSVKEGCGYGQCGSCVVVVNGKAVTSCTYRGKEKLDGIEVVTVEGLVQGFELHPIQKAFIQANSVQCGFCTPGIIMRLYALFRENLTATEEEIKAALSKHLCRCTGYEAILEGAKLAQQYLREKRE